MRAVIRPLRACLLVVLWVPLAALAAPPAALPAPVVPEGFGVSIHFTDPQPGEMEMIAWLGVRWLRTDFPWEHIERRRGEYDFAPYERLAAAAQKHGLRIVFILDYSNKLYDRGLAPHTAEGRRAFARFAAAGVRRLRGRGILWQMWNEPNLVEYWTPRRSPRDYVKLAREVARAIAEAAPGETLVGPSLYKFHLPEHVRFMEGCFKEGLLEVVQGVTVHPYRFEGPEGVASDYRRLRQLIARYAPKGRTIPILNEEWGYSAAWPGHSAETQGRILPRLWLTNLLADVPLSLWYDWRDDGVDSKNAEHNFGLTRHAYRANRDRVYEPKPAYLAAQTLISQLRGFRLSKRLAVGGPHDYVLLFSRGDEVRVVAWSTAKGPGLVTIPCAAGEVRVVGHTGEQSRTPATGSGLRLALADAPLYAAPPAGSDLLTVAAAWERVPLELRAATRALTLAVRNPLGRGIEVRSGQGAFTRLEPAGEVRLVAPIIAGRDGQARVELEVKHLGRIGQHVPRPE
jgi:polysaccharide biosynthesis protein PslG